MYEFASLPTGGSWSITTVATDFGNFEITIPNTIEGRIYYVYLDFYVSGMNNDHGGFNCLDPLQAQPMQVSTTGGAPWHDAIDMVSGSLYIDRAGYTSLGRIYGNIDISSYATKGATIYIRWHNAKAGFNALVFEGLIQYVLRMYII
jgi:hypothetical protein